MNLPTRFLALALAALLSACAPLAPRPAATAAPLAHPAPLILVSIDGFRPDYLQRGVTPVLNALARQGVLATQGMVPSFPSVTFPNH